ncbi:SpoIVB peptidase S55 domain-containing protein [Azotosporobacter soli]|uniref:SpoIVB peptidase S55 domain-containing protein n=1 Tax=Azotosporobacter soli TaxID=3055040 RepID=UPI0031FEEBC7
MMRMHNLCKKICLPLLLLCLMCLANEAQAAASFMPVEDIKIGMTGIGRTVVEGTKIEEFGVEVLGVLKNKGPVGDLILVRTSGNVIERTDGIAQGMSGSPVYIDGRLVGAIAYGWSLTDHRVGMVTPIGDMVNLWELPDGRNSQVASGIQPLATPLMVSGFGKPALEMLKQKLQPYNLVPYATGEAPEGVSFAPLEPGSAIGVQLVRGDASVGALGTVTYVEGDKVVAFGHPFLKKGNIGYFMTNAYMFTTVKSLESSFKVGATGETLGIINQDRGAAVAGQQGRYPNIVPLRIQVSDLGTGRSQDAAVQVVRDEEIGPILATATTFNVIDKAMDRTGPGTAKVSFRISSADLPGGELKRENMFYSPASISESAVGEFFEAVNMLAANQYQKVNIMNIDVSVKVEEERRTATIVEAKAKQTNVKPGQKVDLEVKLKPFRGEAFVQQVTFDVPKTQAEGPLMLEVRGGGIIPLQQLLKKTGLEEELQMLGYKRNKNKTLGDEVKSFAERDHNNDVVVEIMEMEPMEGQGPSGPKPNAAMIGEDSAALQSGAKNNNPEADKGNANAAASSKDKLKKTAPKAKSHTSTEYIIDGDSQVTLNVKG